MVRARSVMESDQVHDDSNDGVLPQEIAVEPAPGGDASPPINLKKRRQPDGTACPKKRRRRKREELCQLNLDVLFLIAEYIHPMDLLNLARTCKSLRELLMDQSSVFIWKTARRQVVGLPDCPVDLTEPEYANLVFCARCHSCGKPARTVFWKMRRRYCPNCKHERIRELSSYDSIVCYNDVVASEVLSINKKVKRWVDKDQMESLLDDYHRSANKSQFLAERKRQSCAISRHAGECERWQLSKTLERRDDLAARREKREKSIFERLEQHGYAPEIAYFGDARVRESYKAVFRTSKPLTNKEWDRMWPEWRKIMADCRFRRMNEDVYQPRRNMLEEEYDTYVRHPTPDGPTFDLLPHVVDLASFDPFRNIIMAPEGTQMDNKAFASAFAQLPDLIDGWKKKLDAELAELVTIPLHLSLASASDGQGKASNSVGHTEASQMNLGKLRLGCAVFCVGARVGPFTHLNAFSVSLSRPCLSWGNHVERPGSIRDRFRIEFLEEAPYIVRACGLDPNTATVDDMDKRNARVRCVSCKSQVDTIMNWRAAMWHATSHNTIDRVPPSDMPRWQPVSDEHIDAIQAVEKPNEIIEYARCLLCRPRVGDAFSGITIVNHLIHYHKVEGDQIKQDVHYGYVSLCDALSKVYIVEEGKATFESV